MWDVKLKIVPSRTAVSLEIIIISRIISVIRISRAVVANLQVALETAPKHCTQYNKNSAGSAMGIISSLQQEWTVGFSCWKRKPAVVVVVVADL